MAEKRWYGPLWPLPKPTAQTAITSALTNPTTSGIQTSEYFEAVARDVIISCPINNTGNVYLVLAATDGTFKASNDGTIILVCPPGGTRNIKQANYDDVLFRLDQIGVDCDDAEADTYYICAIAG